MTQHAREVLRNCRLAATLLEDETDLARWRIHWVAAVALVRAIGHVLDKVDGQDAGIHAAIRTAFGRWKGDSPDHTIFREFIERERNHILKEYRFSVHPMERVPVALDVTLARVEDGKSMRLGEVYELDENVYRPILDGYREGDDARDVLADAMAWWERELDAIDSSVQRPLV